MHLYLKQAVAEIIQSLKHLRVVLVQKAELYVETIMPGYTHLQHA